MGLKRRAFLQRSGLLLAALGLSEAGLSVVANRYQQVLAQPTRRKLALLVGINQYPEQACDCPSTRGSVLNGCLTDVELQRELLVHRFGFQPNDILALTDQQATGQSIKEAFLAHLVDQARPGDVVVFHFSGLGSRVHWDDSADVGKSLVPVDGLLSTDEDATINDIAYETLGLLLRSLSTENITTILDAGHTELGRVWQGNLRVRSRPIAPTGKLNDAELVLQEQLMSQLQVSKEQIQAQWRSGQFPGVLLMAARNAQVATEGQWNGFSAGLFTYALTQQLWQTTPATTLRTTLSLATSVVRQSAGVEQLPAWGGQKIQDQRLSSYYLATETTNADGVVRSVEDDGKALIWLAGLPTAVLENYGASVLAIVPTPNPLSENLSSVHSEQDKPTSSGLLQIRSRDGLTVKARPCCEETPVVVQPGQLVQEVVRILPRSIGLTVALDASLERIERVDATSAFAAIPKVSSVIAGEPADFLFGKTSSDTPTLTASLTPTTPSLKHGYGLFLLGRDAIPSTLIPDDEAVKTAINRITPQLRTLLALKLLRLTANRGSSRLPVQVILEMTSPQERIVMQQETARGHISPDLRETKTRVYNADLFTGDGAITLPIGSRVRYRLQNNGDRPIYFMLLGLDTQGNPITSFPNVDGNTIPPGETLIVPQANLDWVIQDRPGLAETHVILSRSPLARSYQSLQISSKDSRQISILNNPLDVAQMVLQDLHEASAPILPRIESPADTYILDVNAWATLSFVYQVIET